MSAPQVGDVIAEPEELDALPVGSVVIDRHRQTLVRWRSTWGTDGVWESLPLEVVLDNAPFTLVYLPGRPPRPERVVKAEALREALNAVTYGLPFTVDHVEALFGLRAYADRIEAGESS